MTDTELQGLIERLEQADYGSRELDAIVAVMTGEGVPDEMPEDDLIYDMIPAGDDELAPGHYWRKSRSGRSVHAARHYTTSVEDARTLIPEELYADIRIAPTYCTARVFQSVPFKDGYDFGFAERSDEYVALCLTTAALKARQESKAS